MRQFLWAMQLFIILAVVWLALDGIGGWPVGIVAAAAGAAVGATLVPASPYQWRPWRLGGFVAYFIGESVRGGIDVAYRAVAPSLPVDPSFTRFHTTLPAGHPRTLFVSVLSLLPGTLSADLDDARGDVVVHLLVPTAHAGVGRLERKVAWLFSL